MGVESATPFGAFGFKVEVDGGGALGCFQEVSGLGISIDVETLKEGGVNKTTHQLIKGASYSNVTLKRGLCDIGMYKWINDVLEGNVTRYSVVITLLDDEQKPVMKYKLAQAIPVKWDGPTLSVSSDAIATETLVFAHEGLTVSKA
jgi:phage tail-like protein